MENCNVSKPACMAADATFKWVSDPPPTKEEMKRWQRYLTGELCECESEHPAQCKCVTSVDRTREGRLLAMVDANADFFEVPMPFTDDAVPIMALFKCVRTCEFILLTEKANNAMKKITKAIDSFIENLPE